MTLKVQCRFCLFVVLVLSQQCKGYFSQCIDTLFMHLCFIMGHEHFNQDAQVEHDCFKVLLLNYAKKEITATTNL